MSTESGEGYCSALRSYFLTFLTLLWREASISIDWSKWLNTCPTRSWPWQDAFHKILCSGLLNLPFGNHSKKVSLSEIQTKNQSWKQYGRQIWARWKWELERSTCRVCLCWELQHRPFSTWLHIWTIERIYNWTRNLKEAEEAGCNVRKRKSSISLYPSIDFGAICSERYLAVSAPDEMGNTGQNLPRPCPFHFVTIQFQI